MSHDEEMETTPAVPTTTCDLSTVCFVCGVDMKPEGAHYRCPECGWRDSCCF